MTRRIQFTFALVALLVAACSNDPNVMADAGGESDSSVSDSGATDSGSHEDSSVVVDAGHDAGALDAAIEDLGGSVDAGTDLGGPVDSGPVDASEPTDLGAEVDASEVDASEVDAGTVDGGAVTCFPQFAYGVGACELFFGYVWDGDTCTGVSGCSCEGDACGSLYSDFEECMNVHLPCSASCGGFVGASCPPGAFCNFELEAMCGFGDATGNCDTMPEGCLDFWDPVCGCDGMTYSNTCYANGAGVSVSAEGECESPAE